MCQSMGPSVPGSPGARRQISDAAPIGSSALLARPMQPPTDAPHSALVVRLHSSAAENVKLLDQGAHVGLGFIVRRVPVVMPPSGLEEQRGSNELNGARQRSRLAPQLDRGVCQRSEPLDSTVTVVAEVGGRCELHHLRQGRIRGGNAHGRHDASLPQAQHRRDPASLTRLPEYRQLGATRPLVLLRGGGGCGAIVRLSLRPIRRWQRRALLLLRRRCWVSGPRSIR